MNFPCGHERNQPNTMPDGRCRTCKRTYDRRRLRTKGKGTHCHRGHEYTPENSYTDTRGRRLCRSCRALAQERYYGDPGGRIEDVARFQMWMEAYLAANDMTGDRLALRAGLSPRVLYAIRREGRKWLQLDTVDRILCAAGAAELLECFVALDGGELHPLPDLPKPRRVRVDASTRCRSGDECPRRWGHGPNGRFCEHHGAELERIFVELTPSTQKQAEIRRRLFAKGRAAEVAA